MKNLVEYINESLKTIKSIKGQKIESGNYDLIQVVDRTFAEGISDEDFKKFIKQDIEETFKPQSAQVKDVDKVIDTLVDREIEHKLPAIVKYAENHYKNQNLRDKYIEKAKEDIRRQVAANHQPGLVNTIMIGLNPLIHNDVYTILDRTTYNKKNVGEDLLKKFRSFEYSDKVIGWIITYDAYNGTKCPQSGAAYLRLKLDKKIEDIVKHKNAEWGSYISDYYDKKGTGGYTGD